MNDIVNNEEVKSLSNYAIAAGILYVHNRWRKGDDTININEMPFSTRDLSAALDLAVNVLCALSWQGEDFVEEIKSSVEWSIKMDEKRLRLWQIRKN